MRRMSTCLVAAAVLCCSACFADDVERRRELAAELLEALDMKTTLAKSFEATKAMIPAQMQQMQKNLPGQGAGAEAAKAAAKAASEKSLEKTMALIAEEMSWEKMKEDYVGVYADVFTAEEMEALLAFYKSPAGRAFVAKQPELMQRSMEVSQKASLRLMPKLMAIQFESIKSALPARTPPPPKSTEKAEPAAEKEEPAAAK